MIDHTRRYEIIDSQNDKRSSQFACVELVGQKLSSNAPTKENSAGTNLVSLVKKHPKDGINIDLHFEQLAPEGYNDDAEIVITPENLWKAAEKSVCRGDDAELTDLMTKLFVAEVQPFTSPVVADFYAKQIFKK